MKIVTIVVFAATLLAAAPVEAQKLDLSKLTCKEFAESSKDRIGLIMMWLEGFMTDEDDPPIVDFEKTKTDGDKLVQYCANNPRRDLMSAADEVLE